MGNSTGTKRHFTVSEVERAAELRAMGLEWHEVAARIDPEIVVTSLITTMSNYRRGLWRPTRRRTRGLRADLEHAVAELGVTDRRTLCKFFKVTEDVLDYNLKQIGLDGEARRDIRLELDLAALRAAKAAGKIKNVTGLESLRSAA